MRTLALLALALAVPTLATALAAPPVVPAAAQAYVVSSVVATPGSDLALRNLDDLAHTLTHAAVVPLFDTGLVGGGDSRAIRLPAAPGEYEFLCQVHPTRMRGTATVIAD